jgi:hypothetical protein
MKCPQRQRRQVPSSPQKQEALHAEMQRNPESQVAKDHYTVGEAESETLITSETTAHQHEQHADDQLAETNDRSDSNEAHQEAALDEDLMTASLLQSEGPESEDVGELKLAYPSDFPDSGSQFGDQLVAELSDDVDAEGEIDEEYHSGIGTPWSAVSSKQSLIAEAEDPFKLMGSDSKVAPGPVQGDDTPSDEKSPQASGNVTRSASEVYVSFCCSLHL